MRTEARREKKVETERGKRSHPSLPIALILFRHFWDTTLLHSPSATFSLFTSLHCTTFLPPCLLMQCRPSSVWTKQSSTGLQQERYLCSLTRTHVSNPDSILTPFPKLRTQDHTHRHTHTPRRQLILASIQLVTDYSQTSQCTQGANRELTRCTIECHPSLCQGWWSQTAADSGQWPRHQGTETQLG